MENKLNKIFSNVFHIDENVDKTELKMGDLPNWDSMGHLNLITSLEEELDIFFTNEEIVEINSFEKIYNLLKSK